MLETKWCDKCKEEIIPSERDDGYPTPLGYCSVYVEICPHCGNSDLEEVDFSKIDIEWEIGDVYDDAGDGHCFFHEADGEDENGNKYRASAALVDGEIAEYEDIERI